MGIVSQAMRQRYLLSSCIVFVVVVYGDDSWHPLLSDVSIWCNTYTITLHIFLLIHLILHKSSFPSYNYSSTLFFLITFWSKVGRQTTTTHTISTVSTTRCLMPSLILTKSLHLPTKRVRCPMHPDGLGGDKYRPYWDTTVYRNIPLHDHGLSKLSTSTGYRAAYIQMLDSYDTRRCLCCPPQH